MKKISDTELLATSSIEESNEFFEDDKFYRRLEMKRLMLVGAMILGFAGMSRAQGTVNSGNITVSVNLIQSLTITPTGAQTLSMGDVAIGAPSPNVDPTGQNTTGTSASPLQFTIGGEPSHALTVTYPTSVALSNGTDNLTFVPSVSGTSQASSQASSTVFSGGSSSGQTLSASGAYYVYVGGTLSVGTIPSQSAGTYSGTFTISVNY